MGADSDLIKLYSGRILALAGNIPLSERLEAPGATVRKRSPLCGSTVTVDLSMQDGVISEFGQDVKACALGQAAASVLGSVVLGLTPEQVGAARDELKAMLTADGPPPQAPFDGLEALLPARDFKNRHASIMLALEATVQAMEEAQSAA
ncbi:iron-sulfur cluster assembly scaffold protein [Alphaproteobacteria bacterium KMM 3653]|uniref:Iron-sulfur cluster assembly scaffold protein n=1 Tax=Harenicola maris TaxID=2841044 RepID=A0AAP2CQR0_9RHOB|nr:iron-sulfur cluster assembly scaffold protein [Harenicola maris]